MYIVIIYLLLDLGKLAHIVPPSFMHHSAKGTITISVILIGVFTYGYFHYLDKTRQPLEMHTTKMLDKPMKIVMLSDLHLGYHNQAVEFNRWIDMVNAENPDLVLIGGDIIDGHMRPLVEQHMAQAFHRIKAPIVACLGNHEYLTGINESIKFYREAGITLLVDSAVTVNGINIIGRDDRTNAKRRPLKQLMQDVDKSKYTILLDHQPYALEQAERNGIDFQFSGHTHRGQVWPLSWIVDLMYEDSCGPLQKGNTQYYVSSGMGIWGAKFRIGTHSEYVVAQLHN